MAPADDGKAEPPQLAVDAAAPSTPRSTPLSRRRGRSLPPLREALIEDHLDVLIPAERIREVVEHVALVVTHDEQEWVHDSVPFHRCQRFIWRISGRRGPAGDWYRHPEASPEGVEGSRASGGRGNTPGWPWCRLGAWLARHRAGPAFRSRAPTRLRFHPARAAHAARPAEPSRGPAGARRPALPSGRHGLVAARRAEQRAHWLQIFTRNRQFSTRRCGLTSRAARGTSG